MRWTEDEYSVFLQSSSKVPTVKPKRKSKHNAKHTRVDGILFDSKLESEYYKNLTLLMRAGEITGYAIQPKFILVEGNETDSAITYSADFIIFKNDGGYEIVDTKGFESDNFKRTHKQFRLKYPKLDLKIERR